MDVLMDICRKTVTSPHRNRKKWDLALRAMEVKNQAGLDLRHPEKLTVGKLNPLFEACKVGNHHLVQLFIDDGANVNFLDKWGKSPLYTAITSEKQDDMTVECLLKNGADANQYKSERCPLLAAFYSRNTKIIKMLINAGADVNDYILPTFSYVESLFALNCSLVMIASGVRFHLEEFEKLVCLSSEIIEAGLQPRTFYLTGVHHARDVYSQKEMATLWAFQDLCLAAGFRVNVNSLAVSIQQLESSQENIFTSHRLTSIDLHLTKLKEMLHRCRNPMSLAELSRKSIRSCLARTQRFPSKHLRQKIELLPLPKMYKNYVALALL